MLQVEVEECIAGGGTSAESVTGTGVECVAGGGISAGADVEVKCRHSRYW